MRRLWKGHVTIVLFGKLFDAFGVMFRGIFSMLEFFGGLKRLVNVLKLCRMWVLIGLKWDRLRIIGILPPFSRHLDGRKIFFRFVKYPKLHPRFHH